LARRWILTVRFILHPFPLSARFPRNRLTSPVFSPPISSPFIPQFLLRKPSTTSFDAPLVTPRRVSIGSFLGRPPRCCQFFNSLSPPASPVPQPPNPFQCGPPMAHVSNFRFKLCSPVFFFLLIFFFRFSRLLSLFRNPRRDFTLGRSRIPLRGSSNPLLSTVAFLFFHFPFFSHFGTHFREAGPTARERWYFAPRRTLNLSPFPILAPPLALKFFFS